MKLHEIQISHLRNVRNLRVQLHPRFTIIQGLNGSGKTTFLEAIYLLSCGRSFRAHELSALINYDASALTVFADSVDGQRLSIQKSISSPTIARINGGTCRSSSELAHLLPCQVFYADLFDFINAGPSWRRTLLDWGLFHVEHRYHAVWKEYKHVLKQRNALLKEKAPPPHFLPWDTQLSNFAEQLHLMREKYMDRLVPVFNQVLQEIATVECSLKYEKGWDKKKEGIPLIQVLSEQFASDCLRQFTQYGAHQADIQIVSRQSKAKYGLSRGQQKIAIFALKLAQCQLLNKPCLYLIDDLGAELDSEHIKRVLSYLKKIEGQFVLTAHLKDAFIDLIEEKSVILLKDEGKAIGG